MRRFIGAIVLGSNPSATEIIVCFQFVIDCNLCVCLLCICVCECICVNVCVFDCVTLISMCMLTNTVKENKII